MIKHIGPYLFCNINSVYTGPLAGNKRELTALVITQYNIYQKLLRQFFRVTVANILDITSTLEELS